MVSLVGVDLREALYCILSVRLTSPFLIDADLAGKVQLSMTCWIFEVSGTWTFRGVGESPSL